MASKKILFPLLALLAFSPLAKAQFYTSGDDPARLKWYSVKTPHYRIVYPEGLDSLSRVYGRLLEQYRESESWSSGYLPGEKFHGRTPVILHAWHGISNASVAMAPKRMDFYTVPEAYQPDPIPWARMLAIHESRHLAQLQFTYDHLLKPFHWLFGQSVPAAFLGVYPNMHLLEGDAVVAETALTQSGRGRRADFLNYYMSAFDQGDWRNWSRWRYGSFRHYAPDHYALGYLTIAGTRYLYNDPLYMSRYFNKVSRRPMRLFSMRKEVKAVSGKRFGKSFREIMETFHGIWNEEAAVRAPFIPATPVMNVPSWFTAYRGAAFAGEDLYLVRSGLVSAPSLVRVSPSGTQTRLRPFASYTGSLAESPDGKRLWWSESVPHARWGLEMTSRIRTLDLSDGQVRNLTRKGRYYNPVPSPDGTKVAAVEYPVPGGSALVILDAEDGRPLSRMVAPDSLQLVDPAWVGDRLFVSGLSEDGNGIYALQEGRLVSILNPKHVVIKHLRTYNDGLLFSSDRTGVDEIYYLSPADELFQLTATKYGAADPRFNPAGDTLYFTSLTTEGRLPYKTASDALLYRRADWNEVHRYPVADRLTAQEKMLATAKGARWPDETGFAETTFTEPRRYRKLPHIPHLHSWIPLYADYDAIRDLSSDEILETGSLGATLLFQNTLGTASGSLGYSWSEKDGHGAHLKFSYSGLYPVIEAKLDYFQHGSLDYFRRTMLTETGKHPGVIGVPQSRPYINGYLKTFIPWNFSSGGWTRGLIPSAEISVSNAMFYTADVLMDARGALEGCARPAAFMDYTPGHVVTPVSLLKASLRGYVMLPTAPSQTYPRLGVAAEAGGRTRLSLNDLYASSVYGYVYGYLPGLFPAQGLRLSALYQHVLGSGTTISGDNGVTASPRGYVDNPMRTFFASYSRQQLKLTADYVIPLYVGDISWFSSFAYITHFLLKPYFDYTFFSPQGVTGTTFQRTPDGAPASGSRSLAAGGLYTAGADLTAKLANLLWLPFSGEIGVRVGYNGGKSFDALKKTLGLEPLYVGAVFEIDL